MNVKPGDLAILIKSGAGNEGAIVEILGPMGMAPVLFEGRMWIRPSSGFVWMVKGHQVRSSKGNVQSVFPCPDAWLRPVSGLPDTTDVDERIVEPA